MKHWFWCLHCYRAFVGQVPDNAEKDPDGSFYLDDIPHKCKFKDCDGHIGDIWDWEFVREKNPENPETPIEGQVYNLYPGEKAEARDPASVPRVPYEEFELDENEEWYVSADDAPKLMDWPVYKFKYHVFLRRLPVIPVPQMGKDLIPLDQIAKTLNCKVDDLVKKAGDIKIALVVLGML